VRWRWQQPTPLPKIPQLAFLFSEKFQLPFDRTSALLSLSAF
jgi:hypothetical protein